MVVLGLSEPLARLLTNDFDLGNERSKRVCAFLTESQPSKNNDQREALA